jgi:two-component system chemotaxis response regulator CheY
MLKPDIVTMDISMPKMDGIDALTQIMKNDEDAKIIMISALGQGAWIKKAVMLGAKGFVIKPFKEDYVIEALKKL